MADPVASFRTEPRSLDRLMIAVIAALSLTAAASCVSIVFDINRLSVVSHLLSDASSGDLARLQSDVAAGQTSDNQTGVIAAVELVTFVITAGCFITWFHRAYSNLLLLGATSARYGTGWAIGGWFVPILNLWRPKQIANDIWRGSDPRHPGQQPLWREPVSPLLWFWWAAFLLLGILDRAVAQDWNNTTHTTAHTIRTATRLDIASEVATIVAAGLAIAVVRTLTKRERERAGTDRAMVDIPQTA